MLPPRSLAKYLDVCGLEIAVDDALLVRGVERVGDLPRKRERFAQQDGAGCEPIGECRAMDQLQDERPARTGVFDPVDRGDVWMIQGRQHARLPVEARDTLGIGQER
jgi:hypothetical protein